MTSNHPWKSRLHDGGFVSSPGDRIEIINQTSRYGTMISDTIEISLNNNTTGEHLPTYSLPNKIGSWKLLKQIGEIAGRTVEYVTYLDGEEVERIPYRDSTPYKYRFG